MKAFIDSDILIRHLRGERKALNLLKRLRDKEKFELWTGAMQRAEVIFFMVCLMDCTVPAAGSSRCQLPKV